MNLLPKELENIILDNKKDMDIIVKLEQQKEIYLQKCGGKWMKICRFMELSEDFMREYINELDWMYISMNQKLSIQFLTDFQDKIDWKYFASYNKKITKEILQTFPEKINRTRVINNSHNSTVLKYILNNDW